MSEEPDNKAAPDNIDAIRDLLRKLEEVAAHDASKPVEAASSIPVAASREVLASLSRNGATTGVEVQPLPQLPVVVPRTPSDIVAVPPRLPPALTEEVEQRRGHNGAAVAALSFGLGIATAVGVLVFFGPLGQSFLPARKAVEPPAAVVASSVPSAPVDSKTASSQGVHPQPAVVEPAQPVTRPAPQPAAAPEPAIAAPSRGADAQVTPLVEPVIEVPAPSVVLPAEPPLIDSPPPAPVRVAAPPPPPATRQPIPPTASRAPAPAPVLVKPAGGTLAMPARVVLRGGESKAAGLKIEPAQTGDSTLLVVVRNVPAWLTFSKGGAIGNDVWFMPAHAVEGLELTAAFGARGTASIKVQLAAADGRIIAETETAIEASRGEVPQPAPMLAGQQERTDQEIQRLLERGELLINTGEIEAARTLLRSAAEAGNVAAALKLAETYDPAQIPRLGMAVTSADPLLAVRWYVHAEALGSQVATARLAALGRR